MTCLTASDLSLLETLEQELQSGVSVCLLAEIESALLRLRSDLPPADWKLFCQNFPKRRLFETLRSGTFTLRRLEGSAACPGDLLDVIFTASSQGRPLTLPSPSQIVNAWEYSLPVSRSVRARRNYFTREISEVVRTSVKPRILVLGGGSLCEAGDALLNPHLQQIDLLALRPQGQNSVPSGFSRGISHVHYETGTWSDLKDLSGKLGRFDLIYSPAWLDATDDSETSVWVGAGVDMLRDGGRLAAANFAPGSRDAGWVEACWNWRPHYRSEEHLAQLVMGLKNGGIRGHAVFRDESAASAFLEIHAL